VPAVGLHLDDIISPLRLSHARTVEGGEALPALAEEHACVGGPG
jgi:hypothetical protein